MKKYSRPLFVIALLNMCISLIIVFKFIDSGNRAVIAYVTFSVIFFFMATMIVLITSESGKQRIPFSESERKSFSKEDEADQLELLIKADKEEDN